MKPRYVHIGSWNIEHFGKDDDNPDNQYAIAEHIEMSGVSVLALQEMYVTEGMAPDGPLRNQFLRAALDLVEEHTGQRWEYELFRKRDPLNDRQLCGVAWNTVRVRKEGETVRLPVPTSYVAPDGRSISMWDRTPHAVKFRALPGMDVNVRLTDFVLVPLHMKSNVGQRHEVVMTRAEEARSLAAALGALRAQLDGEEDIILLGDTNCKSRSEPAVQAFIEAGFADLNEDDVPTYAAAKPAPFDRIFVPWGSVRKAFLYSRQYILGSASPLSHDRYLSDHYMVKTSIVVRRDDAG
jgi:endonuclease/exonuclease/phosphatase family metal-dependent hydrolase